MYKMNILYPWTLSISEQCYLEVELLDLRLFVFIRSLFFIEVVKLPSKKISYCINIYTAPTREKENKSQRSAVVNNLGSSKSDTCVQSPAPLCDICVKSGQLV